MSPDLIEDVKDKEQESAKTSPSPRDFLEQLDFLDTKTGMMYCAENEEFYREMLLTYLNHNKYGDIHAFYELQDWNNYRILVHAVKSTSLSIGAVELSEAAKQLELAAKEENRYYIESHHGEVMKQYRDILDRLTGVLTEQSSGTQEEECSEAGAHILVVDDDAVNLKVAEKMLSGHFKVSLAKSGKDALGLLEKGKSGFDSSGSAYA